MMTRIGKFFFTAVLIICGQALAQSIDDVGIAAEVVLDDRYPERRIEFENGVNSLADVVYADYPGYRPLTLDLYLPPGAGTDEQHYPLLVVIHGGGWQTGHTRHSGAFSNWPAALASIAAEGFVVTSVEYRLSAEAPFPAAFDDVRTAVRWLRANADQYGIDKSKAIAMGGSAGGHLAAMLGTACGDKAYPAAASDAVAAEESACIQGVVTWYGIFDFAQNVPVEPTADARPVAGAPARFLHCEPTYCDAAVVAAASPITWVDASDPPFLMIHGIEDPVAPIAQSRAMLAKLKQAGVESKLIEIPGVKHSFIGATPEETVNASRQAWDASLVFIGHHLKDMNVL